MWPRSRAHRLPDGVRTSRVFFTEGPFLDILYYTMLCYTALYYAIMYSTLLYYNVLYCTILYSTVLFLLEILQIISRTILRGPQTIPGSLAGVSNSTSCGLFTCASLCVRVLCPCQCMGICSRCKTCEDPKPAGFRTGSGQTWCFTKGPFLNVCVVARCVVNNL